jgi:hypothetical protein
MTKDLTIVLKDRPGTLADVGEALGNAGINIDGLCGFPSEGKGVLHILVEDGEGAKAALEAVGQTVQSMRDVFVVEIENKPGEFGRICRLIADAGVNIDLAYLAAETRVVLGVDDLDKAQAAVS